MGEGAFAYGVPPSFQITVYDQKREVLPTWYKDAIVYQIFPDRFARDDDWRERAEASIDQDRKGIPRASSTTGTPILATTVIPMATSAAGTCTAARSRASAASSTTSRAWASRRSTSTPSSSRSPTIATIRRTTCRSTRCSAPRRTSSASAPTPPSHGISIILDGVFNHTGRDSRYFNYFGNYPREGRLPGRGLALSQLVHLQRGRHLRRLVGQPRPARGQRERPRLSRVHLRRERRRALVAACRRPRLAPRRGRRAARRLHLRHQGSSACREARRAAHWRGLGGRHQQARLWQAAQVLPGRRARRHHELSRCATPSSTSSRCARPQASAST